MSYSSREDMCFAAERVASACGLNVDCRGGHAFLLKDRSIEAYVFPRENIPRLGVYGYYGGHFVEVWEGGRLSEGLRDVVERDHMLSCIYRALLGLGEAVIRVIRLRGKYGDPHVSLSFETRRLQVIREYIAVKDVYLPRISPGEYGWAASNKCSKGVYGTLDGVTISFSSRRIGLVRGLTVYRDCKAICDRRVYENLSPLEETTVEELTCKKIPYKIAAELSARDETICCGYKIRVSLRGWETPLWRRVADRYEIVTVKLKIIRIS